MLRHIGKLSPINYAVLFKIVEEGVGGSNNIGGVKHMFKKIVQKTLT